MYLNNKVILTICARKGSKGIPGKNSRLLLGIPLVAFTLEQAKKLPWVDRIIVSTDDPEVKSIAEKYGISVPFLRPKYLSKDKVAKIPVILHAIKMAKKLWKETYDIIIDLEVTSPLRNIRDINKCLDVLLNNLKTKTVFSVFPAVKNPYFNMVEIDKNAYAHISKKLNRPIIRRQDAPKVYSINGCIYVSWIKDLEREKTYFTKQTRIYVMPEERSIDIDKPLDFEFVEFLLMKQKHRK